MDFCIFSKCVLCKDLENLATHQKSVHMYVCVYECIYMVLCICVCIYAFMHICIYVYMFTVANLEVGLLHVKWIVTNWFPTSAQHSSDKERWIHILRVLAILFVSFKVLGPLWGCNFRQVTSSVVTWLECSRRCQELFFR